ncbi:MAG TPA: OmpA family protein [Acidobacteriaceae bacterium]|nr:OmpA family protein [Acidobacteriaceae bacterium]
MRRTWVLALTAFASCGLLFAQEQNPTATEHWPQNAQGPAGETANGEPIYKITVVGRDIPAINYFHRSGATRIGFRGTRLLPEVKGGADVSSLNGRTLIKAHFEGLRPANEFGVEYLTYVLWAITPEGRPSNLGELLWSHGHADTTVTTNLQSFGLMLTAEPYFAVTMPSDVVVAQNYVLPDKTTGVLETVDAHYSLLPRGAYAETAGKHEVLQPISTNDRSPLDLYEAINAVQIADAGGAEQWAADSMATAKQDLENARDMDIHQKDMKQEITYAREAVQTAEDARIMTIRKIKAHDEAQEREAALNAQQQAQEQAAEAQRQQQAAQAQADQAQQQAQQAREQALQQQQQAQQQAQQAQQQADQAREAAQRARAEQQQAMAQATAAQQQAQQANQQAAAANQQTEQLREKLREQLNQVLQTQETARGLIVNMSDVLFDLNSARLKPGAQVKLAKVAGILATYPGLKMQVEGYTDSTGTPDYNLKLSDKRATSVEAFLIQQGVQPQTITAQGYGEADPVASNSTSSGRAENRRVEMVVSGNPIGIQQQPPAQGAMNQQQPGQPVPAEQPGTH